MGALTSTGPVSIEEYLTNPAYRHYEYIEGKPIQLHVGTKDHSRIQVKCSRKLDEYFDCHPGGYVAVELLCRLKIRGEVRFRLPDIAVVLGPDTSPDSRYLDRAPDLVVEIRSPDDTVGAQLRKFDEYFENGTKMAWLIVPEEPVPNRRRTRKSGPHGDHRRNSGCRPFAAGSPDTGPRAFCLT